MAHPPIGIDLGTTNSLISVFQDGQPVLIPNALGHVLTPSVVSAEGDKLHIGQAARDRQLGHPKNTASAFKRKMGTQSAIRLGQHSLSPEDLSALVLTKLKENAETYLGEPIRDVVISVPAYFNQTQRKATRVAAEIAGLKPLRLINEPTAAALAYGLQDRDGESQFMVVDLGGGTFDVTLLEHFEGVMEVKASSGDAFLGGEDFTEILARMIADQLGQNWAKMGQEMQTQCRFHADRAKQQLSQKDTVDFVITQGKTELPVTLTRTRFEEEAKPLLNRMLRPIERCIYDRNMSSDELDRVILVGGATRMPMIRQMIARELRHLPESQINPDHAVALGAAIQAGLVAKNEALDDVIMVDVTPFSVGIETSRALSDNNYMSGFFQPIIERNTPLPASRASSFYTIEDNQTQLEIKVFQGEAPRVEDNIELGRFRVYLPRDKAGKQGVNIRVTYDTSGLIEVEAHSISSNEKTSMLINDHANGLNPAEVEQRLKHMAKLKMHPRDQEENAVLVARLSRLYAMASGDDRSFISNLLFRFETALEQQDPRKIEAERGEIEIFLDRIDDYYVS